MTSDHGPAARRHVSPGSNLSIFSKGLLLIAVPIVLQLVLLMVMRDLQERALEAERWASHSKDVLTKAEETLRLVIQDVAGQRGSVITNDAAFDAEVSSTSHEVTKRIAEIATLVRDNAAQQHRLSVVRQQAERLARWTTTQRRLIQEGRQAEAARRVTLGEGQHQIRDLRQAMGEFVAEESRLDRERAARVQVTNQRALWTTTLAAMLTLPLAAALVYVFSRGISSRLAVVTNNAALMAAGLPLAAPVEGTDEIARLDAVLHQTSRRLADAGAAEQAARREVEDRAAELTQVNHELAQQTSENEMFVYSVSHDLRSPLVNLQGFSRELVRGCEELRRLLPVQALPESSRARAADLIERDIPESVHFIGTAVTRSAAIIDALLRLSRVGRVEYRWQQVSVETTVSHVLDAMRGTITERDAEIVRHPLLDTWGDPTAIEQIFGNLIGNAVNYLDPTRPGRIEIGMAERSETLAGGVQISASASTEGWQTYYVRDNGLGIPASALAKVFVAFQRLHASRAPGEGIGLAVVRRIVERHRGRIWAESVEGAGATFFVMLPGNLVPDPQAPDDTASATPTMSAANTEDAATS